VAWTQSDLDAIERALAQGTKRVEYQDKEVEYHSLTELMKLRATIRAELGVNSGKSQNVLAAFSKGTS